MKRLALLVLLATGCPPPKPPVPPPGAATCADVCHHLAELGCPAAKPTPKGTPCTEVCANIQSSGVITWNLDCRASAPSCDAADRCE